LKASAASLERKNYSDLKQDLIQGHFPFNFYGKSRATKKENHFLSGFSLYGSHFLGRPLCRLSQSLRITGSWDYLAGR